MIEHLDKKKELKGLRAKDDFLKYNSFISHFSKLDHFTTAMTEEGSDFIKMLELDYDLFLIKGYDH